MAAENELTAPLRPTSAKPWATLTIALASGLIFCFPALNRVLIYNRDLIRHGEIWRAWSGHLVHFSASHLLWNLLIFVAAGSWLELIRPRSARWFYFACPPAIAASLFLGEPTLHLYAGLSGLASGVLVFLACAQLGRKNTEPVWFWLMFLGLLVAKIAVETVTGTPLLVHDVAGFRVVPLAHITGACGGVLAWTLTRRAEKTPAR